MEDKERNPDIQENSNNQEIKKSNLDENNEESVVSDLLHVLGIKKKSKEQGKEQAEKIYDDITNRNEEKNFQRNQEDTPLQIENINLEEIEQVLSDSLDDFELNKTPTKRNTRWKIIGIAVTIFWVVGGLVWKFLPDLVESRPPKPDVVGSYNGNNITIDQLNQFIEVESAKEQEHIFCPTHGYDHSKCDSTEECEVHPIDSLNGYQQMVTKLAVEKIVNDWAEKKGITNREEVQHGMEDLLNDATVEQYMADLHEDNIAPESIPKLEVQEYYNKNQKDFDGKTFEEVEDEIRQTLSNQKDESFISDYIEELKKTAGLQVNFEVLQIDSPTDEEIKNYYNVNLEQYRTEEKAEYSEFKIAKEKADIANKAIRRIKGGESFQDVATAFSQSGKVTKGTLTKGTDDGSTKAVIWEMKEGEVSDPIVNTDGTVSILKLDKKQATGTKPISEVSDKIKGTLMLEKMDKEYTERKNDMLFSVHSRRYTLGEFYTEFKELSEVYRQKLLTYESRKKLVEQIIAKELLLEKSEDGASSDGSKTHDFEELKIQYLYQVMHQEEVDANLKEPTEEEIAKYYEENKELLTTPATVELSMIWIDQGTNGEKKEQALTKANEALASVRDGEDFAEVAKKYSEDSSASSGGELSGTFDKGHMVQEISDVVFSLKKGEFSEVLDYNKGYYIFYVRNRMEENLASLEELSEGIKSHLQEQEHDRQIQDMEEKMLEEAEFKIYNRTLKKLLKEEKNNT